MKKSSAVFLTLWSLAASLAFAADGNDQGKSAQVRQWRDAEPRQWHSDLRHEERAVAAPEIDPGQAMGALVLLSGAMAIVRGYRRRKK